jgi:hypothetical protein
MGDVGSVTIFKINLSNPLVHRCMAIFSLIQLDIGAHPPIPTGSLCLFFIQHIFLNYFIIVSSTLLGLSEASRILQVDTGGLSPNPTNIFCMFSCHHILL